MESRRKREALRMRRTPRLPPTGGDPVTDYTQAAIEAAACALYGRYTSNFVAEWEDIDDESDEPRSAYLDAAQDAIAVALPHLRAMIAEEIEADRWVVETDADPIPSGMAQAFDAFFAGIKAAARIVRGESDG